MGETVKAQVEILVKATAESQFDKVLAMLHAEVIKDVGGKEKALELMKAAMDTLKSQGLTLKVTEVGKPSLAKAGKSFYAIVPYTTEITGKDSEVVVKTFLVGVSSDDGKTWTFINGNVGEAKLRKFLPELPKEPRLPETKVEKKK